MAQNPDDPTRYRNSEDTFSLLEDDAVTDDFELKTIANLRLVEILTSLPDQRMVTVCMGLTLGLSQAEIAEVMHCNRHTIMRLRQRTAVFLLNQQSNEGASKQR